LQKSNGFLQHKKERVCPEFGREGCKRLDAVPYVCNGCGSRHKRTLEKFVHTAKDAHKSYGRTLVASREGIATSPDEVIRIDKIVSPLLKQGQSVHAILENHKDEIMLDEKTVCSHIKAGLFTANVFDQLNVVKMRQRKKKPEIKVERGFLVGRRYRDFISFMEENPDTPVVQMDSVEGVKGADEPVFLTVHFVEAELMLAFKRAANTARSVTEVVDTLYGRLGAEVSGELFQLILADQGSEFSNPSAIEKDKDGAARTRMFCTDPGAPCQKGACENNHTLIRRAIPKGTSLKPYSQKDVALLMNHVNSYVRKKLRNRSPIDVFSFLHDPQVLELLGIVKIAPDEAALKPSLLKK
jgi:IS30 family transposase